MSVTKNARGLARRLRESCPPVKPPPGLQQKLMEELSAGRPQRIALVVHIDAAVLSGFISIPGGTRLSDYLNTPVKFIRLEEVTISRPGLPAEKAAEIYVNKESVKMLRTVESNAARSAGTERPRVVRKAQVMADMQMAEYELSGNLYCRETAGIGGLLEQKAVFLPCTGVVIRDVNSNKEWQTGFAAVNRRQLNSIRIISEN